MKLPGLFFYIACYVFLNKDTPLLAYNAENNMHAEVVRLITNICDFLLHGHSVDDVTAMLVHSKTSDKEVQAVVAYIQDLLNKQYSTESVINILVINNNFEASGIHGGSWFKNSYFVFKAIVVLVLILVVCYLVYKLYQLLPKYPWAESDDEEPNEDASGSSSPSQRINESPDEPSCLRAEEKRRNGVRRKNNLKFLGPYRYSVKYGDALNNAVDKQIEYAKSIGLEPLSHLGPAIDMITKEKRGNCALGVLIDKQIKYAKSIGLRPASVQKLCFGEE